MIETVVPVARPLAARALARRSHGCLLAASAVVGSLLVSIGLTHDVVRTWSNLLVDGFWVLSIALGGTIFIAVHHLSGAAWSAGMRRVAEALMSVLPAAALTIIATLVFGRGSLYAWATGALPPHLVGSGAVGSGYFALPAVFSRAALFLGLWMVLALLMRRTSAIEDSSADPIHHQRMVRYSAIFVVTFAVSFSLATVDWLLSIDMRWTSTIYAVYVFSGLFVEAVAAITLAVVLLHERGYLADVVNANHLHDLGKLLLALTTFWAYIWLSQYLLIWYSNLPEEVAYYAVRTNPPWAAWFLANFAINWVIPFLVLLPRASKRNSSILKWIALLILLGRWLDVYLLVAPQILKAPRIGLLEVSMAVMFAGITWAIASGALRRRPLVVVHDPLLYDCVRHCQ